MSEFLKIGKCQKIKMSENKNVRMFSQNQKMSESFKTGKCQNMKM